MSVFVSYQWDFGEILRRREAMMCSHDINHFVERQVIIYVQLRESCTLVLPFLHGVKPRSVDVRRHGVAVVQYSTRER